MRKTREQRIRELESAVKSLRDLVTCEPPDSDQAKTFYHALRSIALERADDALATEAGKDGGA